MCGCAGGWKGCEACALSDGVISTAPFVFCPVSQSPARRAYSENSTHLADASSLNGMLTNCFDLERSEKEGGNKRCGLTYRGTCWAQ